MVYVLRLVDRVLSPGTLSPVERAFIAGAKVMFDHLSEACGKMLARKVTDLTGLTPYLGEPSGAATGLAAEESTASAARNTRKSPKRARKTKTSQVPKE
jgi:hypothetical protein